MTDPNNADVLARTMADLAQTFSAPTELDATLATVTSACIELIRGVDCADVLLVDGAEFQSLAPTSDLPLELDNAQKRLGEGPCLDAAEGESVIRCNDLRSDARWPRFGSAAVESGIHSMLSFQLYTNNATRGALNLFGHLPDSFDAEAESVGAMLATHAAIALITRDKQTQFKSALASRDIIGQAKGMIMERFNVDAVRAFELLTKLSQTSNTPVSTVAAQVVARGPEPRG